MAHITIEYMIMIPVLIMQIFLFPIAASVIMNTWGDSTTTIQLQTTAGHMGSSIQQLYYTMNHGSMSDGSMKITLDIPPIINGRRVYNNSKPCNTFGYIIPDNERHAQNNRNPSPNFNLSNTRAKRELDTKLSLQ